MQKLEVMMERKAIVIGCGVIGLSTACLLQHRGYQVTIISQATPDYINRWYASVEAGAHWHSIAKQNDYRLQQFERVTYKTLRIMSTIPNSGVMRLNNQIVYKTQYQDWTDPWFRTFVENFEYLTSDKLPDGCAFGYSYDTFTVNPLKYLKFLQQQFISQGGIILIRHVDNILDVCADFAGVSAIFNCTGLGAATLGGVMDADVYPARGQTVLVKGQFKHTMTRDKDLDQNGIAYLIPREDGTCLLGGTFEPYNYNTSPDQKCALIIVDRCRKLCNELPNDLFILRHSVGLRPCRVNGIRCEVEVLEHQSSRFAIVHNYGHGGYGYQSSWGSCAYSIDLLEEYLNLQSDDNCTNAKL
ncbi:hypothetical protein MIR68_009298 [Amoeboaphelidium protococcarum]|nr:hypothetical protein MIR68_009298 [Amoeboaphelidium protococcarum]